MSASTKEAQANAAIYREAARQIAEGMHDVGYKAGQTHGACDVLGNPIFGNIHRADLKAEFYDHFVNQEYYLMGYVCDSETEATQVRILALCFMAAIVEAGGTLHAYSKTPRTP